MNHPQRSPCLSLPDQLPLAFAAERDRLIHLCTALTGRPAVAEDLAQETLLEAWRLRDRLHDPSGLQPWLSAVARHICARWRRKQGREPTHLVEHDESISLRDDTPDLSLELERRDLETLLDRALALLSPESRAILIERYLENTPHVAIAERLGLTEGAVRVRLHRGRLELRRVLATELHDEAELFGLLPSEGQWRPTRMWCWSCGEHRLLARFGHGGGFTLRCPDCSRGGMNFWHDAGGLIAGTGLGPKQSYQRRMTFAHRYYRHGLATGQAACLTCGQPCTVVRKQAAWVPEPARGFPGFHTVCPTCGSTSDLTLAAYLFAMPETQRFWLRQPRLRTVPPQEVSVAGRAALAVSFESLVERDQLDILVERESFRIIRTVETRRP